MEYMLSRQIFLAEVAQNICLVGGKAVFLLIFSYNVHLMAVSQTRREIVNAARQLFAKVGVENATMNGIAAASKRGRRTLYTYFKNKEEVYLAVVESELEVLSRKVQEVMDRDLPPDEKLLEMIFTRLDMVKEVVYRNGTLRAVFFRDIWKVEKVRKKFDMREVLLFEAVLEEGKEKGIFKIDDTKLTAVVLHYCLKGIEVPYIRGHLELGLDMKTRRQYVRNIVFNALQRQTI